MNITTHEQKRVVKEIKEFDVASAIPAWIFSSYTCQKCLWGFNEDNRGDIMTQTIIAAMHKNERYLFHESCFKDEKVEKWIR